MPGQMGRIYLSLVGHIMPVGREINFSVYCSYPHLLVSNAQLDKSLLSHIDPARCVVSLA